MNKNRGYYVCGCDEEWGVAVIATSVTHAKTLSFNAGYFDDEEWIDVKSRWIRGADVIDRQIGVVNDLEEGLRRGFYGVIEGVCERCGVEEHVELYKGRVLCINCIEDLQDEIE